MATASPQHRALSAYAATRITGLTPRELEASTLDHCALRITASQARLAEDRQPCLDAVNANLRLWSVLAEQARRDDIDLTADQRESILTVARFVFARTHAVGEAIMALDGGDNPSGDLTDLTALLDPLTQVNRRLAAGLRGQAE